MLQIAAARYVEGKNNARRASRRKRGERSMAKAQRKVLVVRGVY
jgi:hypothetical protein